MEAERTVWRSIGDGIAALVADERGQDLVEYALLTSAIGFAGVAVWPTISTTIATAYRALNENTTSLWVPPPPGGP